MKEIVKGKEGGMLLEAKRKNMYFGWVRIKDRVKLLKSTSWEIWSKLSQIWK